MEDSRDYLVRNNWEPKRHEFDRRLDYIDGVGRLRATTLLVSGATLGYCGFLFGAFLGFYKQIVEEGPLNFLGEKQNHSYFPATVSEMVYNTSSGGGKCFFAFVLIGGICMLSSWYPWQLRNVYIGDDLILGAPFLGKNNNGKYRGISVLMLRQFLPPIGIMMVACIPAPPAANRHFTDKVSSIVHTMGAVMSIGGYALIELYTLVRCKDLPVKFDTIKAYNKGWGEWTTRFGVIICCLFSIVAFQVFGVLCGQAEKLGICCDDVWEVPSDADLAMLKARGQGYFIEDSIAAAHNEKLLKHTASGTLMYFKLGEYWFEVLAGLTMLYSHLVIWWYCPERHVDLDEELPDPDGDDGTVYTAPAAQ